MQHCWLLLGSNEGDRLSWLSQAIEQITVSCGEVTKRSSIYQTAAWGITEQPDFLNMVVEVNTGLTAHGMLAAANRIENALGRQRAVKWGQRTLDIDILLYGHGVINLPDLVVPHPFMQQRRFTLAPLAELIPDFVHPVLHQTIHYLLQHCPDPLEVNIYKES